MDSRDVKKKLLFIATAISVTLYLGWRTFFTLPFGYGLPSMVVAVVLLVCEIVAGLEAVEQYLTMINIVEPELPVIPDSWFPDVDILIATHNEDIEVLYRTVNGITHFEYPDKSKIHVYICDDNNRPEMAALAKKFGIGYFGLSGNKLAKAGNLNNAIFKTKSPIVVTFDADMIPRSDFLLKSVPYFFLPKMKKNKRGDWEPRPKEEINPDEKIGFIQTCQSFYNPDLFQYNLYSETRIPNEQDYFSREINVGRNRNNSPLYTGSNTLLSREALERVGGIASGSLTEDFETGLRIQALGYRTYAISTILAHGLAPHSITSLLSQRERWGRGCVQAVRNIKLFRMKGISASAKISYFTCLIYWWSYTRMFIYIATPILTALFHFHVVKCTLGQLFLFWFPCYILSNLSMKTLSGGVRTAHWNNLIYTTFFPYLISPIVMETLGFKQRKFVVTAKNVGEKPASTSVLAYPHMFLLAASAIALIMCLRQMIAAASLHGLIIAFWLVVNAKNLVFAIFFMYGRENNRLADRFYVSLPARLSIRDEACDGTTFDVSETGMSVRLDYPLYIPSGSTVAVHVSTEKYAADVHCAVAHIDPLSNGGWKYCLHITEMDEKNRREYFQIVFDRMHTLPNSISDKLTIYDDFNLNVRHRVEHDGYPTIRKFPRIRLNVKGKLDNGGEATIEDFNYEYVWILGDRIPESGRFGISLDNSVSMILESANHDRTGVEGRLCHVLQPERLQADRRFREFLDEMLLDEPIDVEVEVTKGRLSGRISARLLRTFTGKAEHV